MQSFSRALCAAACLFTAATAFAEQVPVHETDAFTLTRSDTDPFEVPIELVAQTASSATFHLTGIESNLFASTDSSFQPWTGNYASFDAFYGITVKEGYKVTGITVTGTFSGALAPAQWTMPGDAGNGMSFSFGAGAAGWHGGSVADLDGSQSFTASTGPQALEGEFGLGFHGATDVWAESVFYYDEMSGEQYWIGSQASGNITGLTMTVNVSAVPEPGTYALLLAGFGVLGVLARRRR